MPRPTIDGLLSLAKDLVRTPDTWVKGHNATTRSGEPVEVDDTKATCWCMVGAVELVSRGHGRGTDTEFATLMSTLSRGINRHFKLSDGNERHVPTVNDDVRTTHADVLACFDRAIEIARREPC